MSPRLSLAVATSLAIASLPATAGAKPVQRHILTAADSATVVKPATGLGHMQSSKAKLSLARDRHVNVVRLRGTKAAPKSARRHFRAVIAPNKTVGARVLLLAGTGSEPTFTWWKSMLTEEGVPFDAIITRDVAPITSATLRNSDTSGKYEAIVLATGSLTDCSVPNVPCKDTMGPDAWTALQTYEKDFAVREIGGYGWPSPAYGTDWGGNSNCGDKSSINLTVTAAGASTFGDLAGTIPTDKGVWGCEMKMLPNSSFVPMVSGPNGPVLGTFIRTDGVETMFNSIDGSDWTIHSKLLFHGMLGWVTKGVYLGTHRNYLGIDVDDVFMGNDRWDPATNVLNPDESTIIRMDPADVLRAAIWQRTTGISLNMLFNGDAADTSKPTKKNPGDPLTQALLLGRNEFRWTSHTLTHANLDASTQAEIETEIKDNVEFAKKNKLPINAAELTTGQHSGLDNPAMPAALTRMGVKVIGSDMSRANNTGALGSAVKMPRWPTGVYYNVGTKAEQLDEYNYLNYEVCGGGPGCLKAPADWDTYVSNEATMIVRHILSNDPRPHYVHQSNLADEGTLYPVADEVLRRYRSYMKAPFAQLSYSEVGATLAQQAAWNTALTGGQVSATISATGMAITSTVPNLAVPVTGTRVGTVYGGLKTGWQTVGTGTTQLGL